MEVLKIQNGVVHIWQLDLRTFEFASSLAAKILSQDEIRFAERCGKRRKREFLVGRLALRQLLSSYFCNVDPWDWSIRQNEFGKPEIKNVVGADALQFNISHTNERLLIGLGTCGSLGVDIETINRDVDVFDLGPSFFSHDEINQVCSLSGESAYQHFFKLWVLKEAFVKAVGVGLSIPLNQISFRLRGPRPGSREDGISVTISDQLSWISGSWRFSLLQTENDHVAALAIQRAGPSCVINRGVIPPSLLQSDRVGRVPRPRGSKRETRLLPVPHPLFL